MANKANLANPQSHRSVKGREVVVGLLVYAFNQQWIAKSEVNQLWEG
jgi:hypothetical protein